MDNYIVINGKKAELTEKQLKALGIEVKKNRVFNRAKIYATYYRINHVGEVIAETENHTAYDDNLYNVANYCIDKAIMEQRALHETLNRWLWRFSMEHDGEKIDWNNHSQQKYFIYFDSHLECSIGWDMHHCRIGAVYFYTREIAEQAINEVIKPFMAEHPEFRW